VKGFDAAVMTYPPFWRAGVRVPPEEIRGGWSGVCRLWDLMGGGVRRGCLAGVGGGGSTIAVGSCRFV